ncbi:MAG: ATP-binding protein [Hyphomicrobiales bacterium]|nr:ATP-binding protein [Hyphomicrobiales bacterium]
MLSIYEHVVEKPEAIAAILLESSHPQADQMLQSVLQKVRNDIPLVLIHDTIGDVPESMQKNTNVYYHLFKPLSAKKLVSVVESAIEDYQERQRLEHLIQQRTKLYGMVEESIFTFRTLEEVQTLAIHLATLFPEPERVIIGLMELLVNAVEHGNLEISYEEKGFLKENGVWEQEISKRLSFPKYSNRRGRVYYCNSTEYVEVTVTDEGPGFDWQKYLSVDFKRLSDNHGRGIALSCSISFDMLQYSEKGNKVTCRIKHPFQEEAADENLMKTGTFE